MLPREQALALLAGRIPPGPRFFQVAAQALALGVGCRWAGVGKLLDDGESVEVLSFWDSDHWAEPFTFQLQGSPCHEVYQARPDNPHGFFPCDVAGRFPDFPLLAQMGARSYRGEVFYDTEVRPIGHVFVISEHDTDDSGDVRDFFRLVSQRVGAEYNRWRAEEALALSEQSLRCYEKMAATNSDRMAFVDTGYRYRAVNQSYLDALGQSTDDAPPRTREDVVGHTVAEVLGEGFFRNEVKTNLDRCFAGSEVSLQEWLQLPGSPRRYLHVRHHPFRDEDGSISGTVTVIRDLTRQKQNQEKLVELSAEEAVIRGDLAAAGALITETMAEQLDVERVGIWILEGEPKRRLCCQDLYQRGPRRHCRGKVLTAEDSPGHFEALAEGRTLNLRSAELDRPQGGSPDSGAMLGAPIRVSGEVVGLLCHEHVGGTRIWQAAEVTFAREAADLVAQTIMHRDRRSLEQRLYQSQKMESLGVLAGGIAHDFNNLLVGILGGAELALAKLPADHETRRHMEVVCEAAQRASELCSQMLAYSGKGKFLLEAVNLSKVVEDTAQLLHASLTKNAMLRFRLTRDLMPIEVDVTQVRQIVMNLITNAADALGESDGSVTLSTGVRLCGPRDFERGLFASIAQPGAYVYLEVTDTGCGMDEETRARIFDPFFTTKFTGRGLGLAAVLGIVRGHGGGIAIKSVPGTGTTIRVFFPASAKVKVTETEDPVQPASQDPAPPTALVVDDEEVVRLIAGELLAGAGYRVMTACDGLEGVELFQLHAAEIDVVILDVTMPRMSGQEAFERIRRRSTDVPIVLASGYTEEDTIQRFAGKAIAGFLHKPFHAETFLDTLRRAAVGGPRQRIATTA